VRLFANFAIVNASFIISVSKPISNFCKINQGGIKVG